MNTLSDPTMAGIKDPKKKIRKLEDSRLNLWLLILQMQDQISCIEHEIRELKKA
jgi:hypothetical protein